MNTRIAPSPSGLVHLGTMRTIYHNWLAARSSNGRFLLRIDDTDLERSQPELIDPIYRFFDDYGLDYDETFKQSSRFDMYRLQAKSLVSRGLAENVDGCTRLCLPEDSAYLDTKWHDSITGPKLPSDDDKRITRSMVLIKSDGSPTYHFATVIDDIDCDITCVIRGTDHISNTYRQAVLWEMFNYPQPAWAHVGLLCHTSGKKLSKRDSDEIDISKYNKNAVLNWLLRFGWAPTEDNKENQIIPKEKALRMFLKDGNFRAANAKVDMPKLAWLDKQYNRMEVKNA